MIIYDIEVFPNYFLAVFDKDGKYDCFELSFRRNQIKELIRYIEDNIREYFLGYNNLDYDAQIISYILDNPDIDNQTIKNMNDDIINNDYQYVLPWKIPFKNLDIYKIKHYNSDAKRTSLKFLQYSIKEDSIEELPFEIDYHIDNDKDADKVIEYCIHDVKTTKNLASIFKDDIESRFLISKEFKINCLNSSEPSLVKKVYVSQFKERFNIDKDSYDNLVNQYKSTIEPFKINLPKYLSFKNKQFQELFEYYQNLVIYPGSTKGAIKEKLIFKDNILSFGLGGLHSCNYPGVYSSNKEYIIYDIDFVSFYPWIILRNKIFPPYLSEFFLELYESFFHKRKLYPKSHALNGAYKLMLNSTFGLFNEEHSPIHYPYGAMFTTITGQLTLLMLMDNLSSVDYSLLQTNTDGITIRFKRTDIDKVQKILNDFVEIVKINVEVVEYKKMFIRDVNNYFSLDYNNKLKQKGYFETDSKQALYKTNGFGVIKLAVIEYLTKGTDYREFIRNHKNIYDFLTCIKSKKGKYFYNDGEKEISLGKINRYYISNSQTHIYKKYSNTKFEKVEDGFNTKLLNKIEEVNDINYKYYFAKATEIIEKIDNKQLKLFL